MLGPLGLLPAVIGVLTEFLGAGHRPGACLFIFAGRLRWRFDDHGF
jgi:hypothetical protein